MNLELVNFQVSLFLSFCVILLSHLPLNQKHLKEVFFMWLNHSLERRGKNSYLQCIEYTCKWVQTVLLQMTEIYRLLVSISCTGTGVIVSSRVFYLTSTLGLISSSTITIYKKIVFLTAHVTKLNFIDNVSSQVLRNYFNKYLRNH